MKNEITLEQLIQVSELSKVCASIAGKDKWYGAGVHNVPREVAEQFVSCEGVKLKYLMKGTDSADTPHLTIYTRSKVEVSDDLLELTLEEIAELKGIPVERLRIKE